MSRLYWSHHWPVDRWEAVRSQRMREIEHYTRLMIHPPMLLNPDTGEITPLVPGGVTTVNVKENAAQYLDQVKSHLANVEGQLASTKAQLNIRTKELAQEKGLRESAMKREERALYVNHDGTTKNTFVILEPDPSSHGGSRVAREINLVETRMVSMSEYHSNPTPVWKRRYRLMFSQPSLHVYQEV